MKTAKQILQEMGYNLPTFDSNLFCEIVSNFFRTQKDPSATILLTQTRFVEMENPTEVGFIDLLDTSIWEKKVDDPEDPFDFIDYDTMQRKGLIRPIIVIDEPFVKNAAQVLTLYGFVCKKRQRKKKTEFIVSLV